MKTEIIKSGDFEYGDIYRNGMPFVFLGHKCDEWEIGSIEKLEKFLSDGQNLLNLIKEKNDELT